MSEPKTFGKHDFTGYDTKVIKDCITKLDQMRPLPGPFAVLHKALLAAYTENTGEGLLVARKDLTDLRPSKP